MVANRVPPALIHASIGITVVCLVSLLTLLLLPNQVQQGCGGWFSALGLRNALAQLPLTAGWSSCLVPSHSCDRPRYRCS